MDKSKSGRGKTINGFLLGAIISGPLCFVVGIICGNMQIYYNRFRRESVVAERIVALKPEFSSLSITNSSRGEVVFAGTLPTKKSCDELEAAIIEQFGRADLPIHIAGVVSAEVE